MLLLNVKENKKAAAQQNTWFFKPDLPGHRSQTDWTAHKKKLFFFRSAPQPKVNDFFSKGRLVCF